MASSELKKLSTPDETRKFDNGQIEVVNIGGGTVGRATFQPGWKWSKDVKPIAKTELCEAPHFMYQLSGRMHVEMKDGTVVEEKIYHEAGATTPQRVRREELVQWIRDAGRVPVERDTLYNEVWSEGRDLAAAR